MLHFVDFNSFLTLLTYNNGFTAHFYDFSRAVLDVPGFIYIKESAHHIEAPRKFDITLVSQAIVLLDDFL